MQFQLLHLYENISQRVFILKSDIYAFRSDIYFPDLILDFFGSFSVEFSREVCRSPNSSPLDPIKTRLFSKSQQRYICFNRRGRVRSVVS